MPDHAPAQSIAVCNGAAITHLIEERPLVHERSIAQRRPVPGRGLCHFDLPQFPSHPRRRCEERRLGRRVQCLLLGNVRQIPVRDCSLQHMGRTASVCRQ